MNDILDAIRSRVPQELVTVRPSTPTDTRLLAKWIERGRYDGHFRRGEPLTAQSVLHYQNSQRNSGWDYHCLIIENSSRSIGYLDYRVNKPCGEILGIYLEPPFRGKRIGQHMIRWAMAGLTQRGCEHVLTEVYTSNKVSIRTCESAGFCHDPTQDRVEPQGQVWVMRRNIEPAPRMSDLYSRYALLRGDNIYLHHAALAEVVVEHFKQLPGVQMILGMGSLARQFADKWSDLDIAVVGSGKSLKKLWRGEQYLAGVSTDLFVVDLEGSPPSEWDYSRRQAFEESVILFARDPKIVRSIHRAIRLSRNEVKGAILEPLFKLGWIGFQPRNWFNKTRYGYLWGLPHDLWIQRGSVESAHATVDQAMDFAVRLVYLANGKHIPDPKWRYFLLPSLKWKPREFSSLISKVLASPRSRRGFDRRVDAVFSIVQQTVTELKRRKLLSTDLYRDYLKICPDYDSGG